MCGRVFCWARLARSSPKDRSGEGHRTSGREVTRLRHTAMASYDRSALSPGEVGVNSGEGGVIVRTVAGVG